MQTEMTTSERLKVVAEFDKPEHYLLNNFSDKLLKEVFRYDRDWNDLIRAVKKFDQLEAPQFHNHAYTAHCDKIDAVIVTQYEIWPAFLALSDAISWYNSLTK